MDPELVRFGRLTLLRLCENNIETIENLPTNLRELHLFSNPVRQVSSKLRSESLVYLGLGYCQLGDAFLEGLSHQFPSLLSLELAHNLLVDLEFAVDRVRMLS